MPQKKQQFVDYLKAIDPNQETPLQFAARIGIALSTYYKWMQNEELKNIVSQERAARLPEILEEVLQVLIQKALMGDMIAIKTFLKRYDEARNKISDDQNITFAMLVDVMNDSLKKKTPK